MTICGQVAGRNPKPASRSTRGTRHYTNGDRFTGSGPNRTRKRGRSEFNHGGCSAVGPVAVAVEATGPVLDTKGRAMTVDELEALLTKADKRLDQRLYLERHTDGRWSLTKQGPAEDDVNRGTFADVVAKLQEWATPPKPATLTIEVPFSWAERWLSGDGYVPGDCSKVDAICRNALKPWTQS